MSGLEAGSDVLSYCGRCKMDLNHVVIAMKGTAVLKAQCRTCNATHGYRSPKGITEPGQIVAKKKRTTTRSKAEPIEAVWTRMWEESSSSPVLKYNMKEHFGHGFRVDHPKYGSGIVDRIIHPNKIEVVFKDDKRVLIHGGPPANET